MTQRKRRRYARKASRSPRAARFASWLSLGVEAYYKDMANLAFAEYSEISSDGIRVDTVEGMARGVDLLRAKSTQNRRDEPVLAS